MAFRSDNFELATRKS